MKISALKHSFVSSIPEPLENGILYACLQYNVVIHKCACGCGEEIVTPLDPRQWTLEYNGEGISLSPSIGNWNLPCRSHYWIKNSKIIWLLHQIAKTPQVQEPVSAKKERWWEKILAYLKI